MEIFVHAKDNDLWDIIVGGPKVIHNTGLDDRGEPIPKPKSSWIKDDKVLMGKNSEEIKMLHCALNEYEFTRISACKSAKEV